MCPCWRCCRTAYETCGLAAYRSFRTEHPHFSASVELPRHSYAASSSLLLVNGPFFLLSVGHHLDHVICDVLYPLRCLGGLSRGGDEPPHLLYRRPGDQHAPRHSRRRGDGSRIGWGMPLVLFAASGGIGGTYVW